MLLIYETAFDAGTYIIRREASNRMFLHSLKESSKVNIGLDGGNIKIINNSDVGGDILTIHFN